MNIEEIKQGIKQNELFDVNDALEIEQMIANLERIPMGAPNERKFDRDTYNQLKTLKKVLALIK